MVLLQELESCLSVSPAKVGTIACLVGFAVPVFLWDLRHTRIPNGVTVTFILVVGFFVVVTERPGALAMPGRMVVGLCIPLVVRHVTRNGVGMGDVHLSCGIAVLLGVKLWSASMLVASLLAILCLVTFRQLTDSEAGVPFGPFLMSGAILSTIGMSGLSG